MTNADSRKLGRYCDASPCVQRASAQVLCVEACLILAFAWRNRLAASISDTSRRSTVCQQRALVTEAPVRPTTFRLLVRQNLQLSCADDQRHLRYCTPPVVSLMGSGKLISVDRLRPAASSHGGRLWPRSDRQSCKPVIFEG